MGSLVKAFECNSNAPRRSCRHGVACSSICIQSSDNIMLESVLKILTATLSYMVGRGSMRGWAWHPLMARLNYKIILSCWPPLEGPTSGVWSLEPESEAWTLNPGSWTAGQKVSVPNAPAVGPTRSLVAWNPRGCRPGTWRTSRVQGGLELGGLPGCKGRGFRVLSI